MVVNPVGFLHGPDSPKDALRATPPCANVLKILAPL